MSDSEEPTDAGVGSSGRFEFLQARRDLQSNWEVDLAKNLEDYLLKICSGEATSEPSVNFAEAALLLQGSVQVYSRKVEYLYSLVLHVLEFLSQKSRKDQQEKDCAKQYDNAPSASIHEEDDVFLGLDDVPVEAKNCRDDDKIELSNYFFKAPTNLLVLEGDCLDTRGEAYELDSYLLASSDFYGDFLLLDPCDAGGIDSFLQKNAFNKAKPSTYKGISGQPKTNENVSQTPIGRSGGSINASLRKNQKFSVIETPVVDHAFEKDSVNEFSEPHADQNHPEETYYSEETHFGDADTHYDPDEEEDPWKPLNPHEPGNLKVKAFKKGRNLRQKVNPISKKKNQCPQFPLAKMNGIISSELAESIEVKVRLSESQNASQSPALYEKLRGSLSLGGHVSYDFFAGLGAEDQDTGLENDLPDFDQDDYDMAMEPPSYGEKESDCATKHGAGFSSLDDLDCSQNLEDLCRSHLDGLLAMIAETEKQTELAARVSTWKQKIEKTLKDQDKHPAFDIHQYGERIQDKLSLEADDSGSVTFTDVVVGQPKHEVARTFSALLQLVNNGNVDLQRPQPSDDLVCYTAKKPFHIKLLRSERRKVQINVPSTKKRLPSPLHKGNETSSPLKPSKANDKLSVKLKKGGLIRHTPEGKRRRRAGLAKLQHSATDV
ncbi:condensin-2 complex subunit H2 isoform X1 [Dendrobium catenatum]|uniref:Condensin-2 complex subunit H2 n=1 Tax=Dendrobium catenatum TaxID=906689 RepID=A0A2I0VQ37_9ASPA|nr:condensin-2 complex subunit H2 isoform X1 [Dendrobium catenatum]PKU65515.1 Condensin-2 complex subunit H2 [Dendrobium catenatum]